MADNDKPDAYNNYQDNSGKLYQTPDNQAPTAGSSVKINENGQTHDGYFWNGNVHKS